MRARRYVLDTAIYISARLAVASHRPCTGWATSLINSRAKQKARPCRSGFLLESVGAAAGIDYRLVTLMNARLFCLDL